MRCSKKRVTVRNPGSRFSQATRFARLLGVLDQGWVVSEPRDGPDVGDVGDFISEGTCANGSSNIRIIAFRADRNGMIHMMERRGVLIGFPGELGTVNLTAADVETLGVSDLKVELEARGVKATVPESGAEVYLKNLLWRVLHRLRYSISVSLDHPLEEWETIRQIL